MNGNGENHSFNLGNPIDVATLLVNKINAMPALLSGLERDIEAGSVGSADTLKLLSKILEQQLVIMAALQAVAIPAAQNAQRSGLVVPGVAQFPRRA